MTEQTNRMANFEKARRIRKVGALVRTGFLIFPLLLLVFFIGFMVMALSALGGGSGYSHTASAQVTSVTQESYGSCGVSYIFRTGTGEFAGSTERVSGSYCDYVVDDEITITFNPADPGAENNFKPEDISEFIPLYLWITGAILFLELAGTVWALTVWLRLKRSAKKTTPDGSIGAQDDHTADDDVTEQAAPTEPLVPPKSTKVPRRLAISGLIAYPLLLILLSVVYTELILDDGPQEYSIGPAVEFDVKTHAKNSGGVDIDEVAHVTSIVVPHIVLAGGIWALVVWKRRGQLRWEYDFLSGTIDS